MLERASSVQGKKLESWIIEQLEKAEIIQEREDCGKTISELCKQAQTSPLEVAMKTFKSFGAAEVYTFSNLTIMSDEENPCPECGCKLEVEHDGADGYEWEEHACSNSDCDYKNTTEPDWDLMPGGADYDY